MSHNNCQEDAKTVPRGFLSWLLLATEALSGRRQGLCTRRMMFTLICFMCRFVLTHLHREHLCPVVPVHNSFLLTPLYALNIVSAQRSRTRRKTNMQPGPGWALRAAFRSPDLAALQHRIGEEDSRLKSKG